MASSKTSETYNSLKTNLLNGKYAPGEQLRIDAIGQALKVSKGAVREALSRLVSEHLVTNTPQKGFVVASVSSEELLDLTEVRIELENRCLELSIKNGDIVWESRILSAYYLLSRTPLKDVQNETVNLDWTEKHVAFHDALISACNSEWRLRLRRMTYLQAERYRLMTPPKALTFRDANAEHKAIMEATLARDSQKACELMAQHLRLTTNVIIGAGIF